ncbi:M20 family metallopeptidase [Coxiella burnetii]|uniref:M20 family metallopeptidase n=1 Tax=Coxiella burnetii TaxID=777 RepID=UPI0022312467|nr:M20 family metallopeptidase [Coxiella burnetii]
MKKTIEQLVPKITTIRREIHAHPELPFKEEKTAALVIKTLRAHGYETIEHFGKTGVVATLDTKRPGKTLAFHANMDALPLAETNTFHHKSKHKNVMHACGYDGHTAILLTIGAALAIHKKNLNGKFKLIFQPAEEIGKGAKAMIKEGALKNSTIDAIFGFHNYPTLAVGKIALRPGAMFAGISRFVIKIKSQGGHGHRPSETCNPIHIGNDMINEITQLSAQLNLSSEELVITINQFHAGKDNNAIPSLASIHGSIRAVNKEIEEKVKSEINELIKKWTAVYDATITLKETFNCIPIINDEDKTAILQQVATEQLGKENVISLKQPLLAYDDFAYFTNKIPPCYFLIGNGENCSMVHTSTYDFCDDAIPIAARILCEVALRMQGPVSKKHDTEIFESLTIS